MGETAMENAIVVTSFIGTVMFSIAVVFMLAVAEHTYFQVWVGMDETDTLSLASSS